MELTMNKSQEFVTPYSDIELKYFRSILMKKIRESEEEIESLHEHLQNIRYSEDENSSSSTHHMADIASDEESVQMYYRLIQRTKSYLKQLHRALQRIENKTYGVCRATGKKIPKERLEIVPHTRYGVEAKLRGLDKMYISPN